MPASQKQPAMESSAREGPLPQAIVSKLPEHLECSAGEEQLVLNLRNERYFGFNEVASDVWRLLDVPKTIEELVLALQQAYDVEAEECRLAVRDLVLSMEDNLLVSISPPPGP